MEDIAEQQEVANEIAEAISNPVGFGQDVDEDELLKELEELEQVGNTFYPLYWIDMCLPGVAFAYMPIQNEW